MTETLDCNTIVDTWRGIAGGIRATSTSTLEPLGLAGMLAGMLMLVFLLCEEL